MSQTFTFKDTLKTVAIVCVVTLLATLVKIMLGF